MENNQIISGILEALKSPEEKLGPTLLAYRRYINTGSSRFGLPHSITYTRDVPTVDFVSTFVLALVKELNEYILEKAWQSRIISNESMDRLIGRMFPIWKTNNKPHHFYKHLERLSLLAATNIRDYHVISYGIDRGPYQRDLGPEIVQLENRTINNYQSRSVIDNILGQIITDLGLNIRIGDVKNNSQDSLSGLLLDASVSSLKRAEFVVFESDFYKSIYENREIEKLIGTRVFVGDYSEPLEESQ